MIRSSRLLRGTIGIVIISLLAFVILVTAFQPIGDQAETDESILKPISLEDPFIVLPGSLSGDFRQESVRILKDGFIDQPAPEFSLLSLEGEEIALSDFQGQPVLINFWASWCLPCRTEMPDLVSAYERYKEQGFVILGVNFTYQDTLPEVRHFVNEFEISYPVLLDEAGYVTSDSYRMLGLPMSVFINRDGIVKRLVVGPLAQEEIDLYISEIVADP